MMAQGGVHHSSPPTFERRELEMKFAEDFVFESGKFSFLCCSLLFLVRWCSYFCFFHKDCHETHPRSLGRRGLRYF